MDGTPAMSQPVGTPGTPAQPQLGVGGLALPVPDIRHLEQKDLLERLAQANRDRQDDRLKFDRLLQAAQVNGKVDIERLRATTASHMRDLEAQNSALLKSLARLQGDVERLERENLTLRVTAGNAVPATPPPAGGHAT